MIAAVTVLMMAHLAEVLVWSLAYAIFSVAPEGADIVYFAFVNYTMLGCGDVTPVVRWLLLGPMSAMNGVLLFGWSPAVIFEVSRMTLLAGEGEKPGGEVACASSRKAGLSAGLWRANSVVAQYFATTGP